MRARRIGRSFTSVLNSTVSSILVISIRKQHPQPWMEMEVFEFKKSLLVRHQEASHVLNVRGVPIPASAVQKEWSLFLEVAMESNGWQALWRIPRAVCQELSTKFPTVVAGTVEKVGTDPL